MGISSVLGSDRGYRPYGKDYKKGSENESADTALRSGEE